MEQKEIVLDRRKITSLPSKLPDISALKTSMMDRTGIVRTKASLEKQVDFLEDFEVEAWLKTDLDHLSLEELNKVFMLICSWIVTKSALTRTESRGGHLRKDYPNEDKSWETKQIIQQIKGDNVEQIKVALTN
jgi:L-aspartate oxidase